VQDHGARVVDQRADSVSEPHRQTDNPHIRSGVEGGEGEGESVAAVGRGK
jgi:hypothetical protein